METPSRIMPFACGFCGAKFDLRMKKVQHEKRKHWEQFLFDPFVDTEVSAGRVPSCDGKTKVATIQSSSSESIGPTYLDKFSYPDSYGDSKSSPNGLTPRSVFPGTIEGRLEKSSENNRPSQLRDDIEVCDSGNGPLKTSGIPPDQQGQSTEPLKFKYVNVNGTFSVQGDGLQHHAHPDSFPKLDRTDTLKFPLSHRTNMSLDVTEEFKEKVEQNASTFSLWKRGRKPFNWQTVEKTGVTKNVQKKKQIPKKPTTTNRRPSSTRSKVTEIDLDSEAETDSSNGSETQAFQSGKVLIKEAASVKKKTMKRVRKTASRNGVATDTFPINKGRDLDGNEHICYVCSMNFRRKESLRTHLRINHQLLEGEATILTSSETSLTEESSVRRVNPRKCIPDPVKHEAGKSVVSNSEILASYRPDGELQLRKTGSTQQSELVEKPKVGNNSKEQEIYGSLTGTGTVYLCCFCSSRFLLRINLVAHYYEDHANEMGTIAQNNKSLINSPKMFQTHSQIENPADSIRSEPAGTSVPSEKVTTENPEGPNEPIQFHKNLDPGIPKQCHSCSRSFSSHQSLANHLKYYDNHRVSCPYCERKFSLLASLRRHVSTIHSKRPRPVDCVLHGANPENLKETGCLTPGLGNGVDGCGTNVDRKRRGRPPCGGTVKCLYCPKYMRRSRIILHERVHTRGRRYKCPKFPQTLAQNHDLQTHTLMHPDRKPFCCTLCPRGYTHKYSLKVHLLLVHNFSIEEATAEMTKLAPVQNKSKVNVRGESFVDNAAEADRRFSCDLPSQRFRQQEDIEDPHRSARRREEDANIIQTHRHVEQGSMKVMLEFTEISRSECMINKTSGEKGSVSNSSIDSPQVEALTSLNSKHCHKRFPSDSHLAEHLRSHTGKRSLVYSMCNTKFCSAKSLAQHSQDKHTSVIGVPVVECGVDRGTKGTQSNSGQDTKRRAAKKGRSPVNTGSIFEDANTGLSKSKVTFSESEEEAEAEQLYICILCDSLFDEEETLKEHLSDTHKVPDDKATLLLPSLQNS